MLLPYDKLSENQCGMETVKSTQQSRQNQVEREPMWDGNLIDLEEVVRLDPVEREPMWDGNA